MIAGIDLSLTKTGFAVLDDNGKVLTSGIIKSKPQGKLPIHETKRIATIIKTVIDKIAIKGKKLDMVAIEGLAFNVRNSTALVQLAGLSYYLRILLVEKDIQFLIIAPTTLKKFITGSGRGDKDMMMMKVYKKYGFESLDNNECDAYSLAVCALATRGTPILKNKAKQKEVIKLLKKQI